MVKQLRGAGFIINDEPDVEIQNMVASAHVSSKVDLEGLADSLDNIMYEPEQFPALIYRMVDPKVVILIFASGSIVITGAKSEEQVMIAADKIKATLMEYKLLF